MSKRVRWAAAALIATIASGVLTVGAWAQPEGQARQGTRPPRPAGMARRAYWRMLGIKTSKLQIEVKDAITQRGIPGAGCTIAQTGDRVETDQNGVAPMIDAPVFRNPRVEEILAELHGALIVLCYKNGYRDAIFMNLRMYEGVTARPEVWMYPISDRDRRIEPTVYEPPEHRLWMIQLADRFRLFDEGEGPERPGLSRPDPGVPAPQDPLGGYVQTPVRAAPPQVVVPGGQLPVPPQP